MEGTVREISSLNAEIKRLNTRKRDLMDQKKRAQQILYNYMNDNNLEEYKGIKVKRIEPKPKRQRASIKHKRDTAIDMLFRAGIPDPQGFWSNYEDAVKPK